MYALTIVPLAYTILSLLVYCLMITIVISIRKQFPTFVLLTVFSSIIKITYHLNTLVQIRFLLDPAFFGYYEWLIAGQGIAYVVRRIHFIWYVTGWLLMYSCTFLTALSRFTAIVLYEKHEKIWQFRILIMLGVFAIVLVPAAFLLGTTHTYVYRPIYNDYVLDYTADQDSTVREFVYLAIYSCSFTFLSIPVIILTIKKLRDTKIIPLRRKSIASLQTFKGSSKAELSLFTISIVDFASMLLNFLSFSMNLNLWLSVIPKKGLIDFLDIFFPICSSIFCLSLPYYTLSLPGPVNTELRRFLNKRFNTRIHISYFSMKDFVIPLQAAFGVCSNLLLLVLIVKCSSRTLGHYRYLLFIFNSVNIFLIIYHAATETRIIIVDTTLLGIVSNTQFQSKSFPVLYCAFFSVPLSLTIIHYLYRYWAIKTPHKLILFTSTWFQSILIFSVVIEAVAWYLLGYFGTDGSPYEIGTTLVREAYRQKFNISIWDGWLVMDNWRNDQFSVKLTITIVGGFVLMATNFILTFILSNSTFLHIKRASQLSAQLRKSHFTIFAAVTVQGLIPVILVYVPYFCTVNFPYFKIPMDWLPGLELIGSFPGLDALAVTLIMKDYRKGLINTIYRIFCCGKERMVLRSSVSIM